MSSNRRITPSEPFAIVDMEQCGQLVAMCATESRAREALRRIGLVMDRPGLTLHPANADGGLETRQGFVFSGMHDSREEGYPAKAGQAFHAALAEPEVDEEAPGRAGVDRQTRQRARM